MALRTETDNQVDSASRVRRDIRPEDVLDRHTLDEIARKQDEAEANLADRSASKHAFDDALTSDDLRDLARRTLEREGVVDLVDLSHS